MATILQLRRGTTTQHSTFTGAEGEVTVDSSKFTVVVHDGSTAGGYELALADLSNTDAITLTALSGGTGITYTNTSGEIAVDTTTIATKTYVDSQVQSKDALSELSGTTDDVTEGSTNLYYTSTRANADFDTKLAAADTDDLSEGSSNLYYTDARVKSLLTSIDGNIVPSADVTYTLGTASLQWKDVYVGPGSLYVNGQKVLEENSGNIVVSADANQNLVVQTSGSGNVELDPTGTGVVAIKGTLQVEDGTNITNSAGNDISFANNIKVNQITTKDANTNLVLSGNGTGIVQVADSLTVTGDLTISGTTTTVNSETIQLADNNIVLNSNFTSGTPTEDAGLTVSRGSSSSVTFLWDETNDKWTVGDKTFVAATFQGNLTGDVTGNVTGDVTGNLTGTASNATTAVTLTGLTSTIAELNYVDGVTSNVQTQLDAKLASSSYTAADVLTKIKTVDGAGSGLDADTLDGNQATAFATAAQGALADSAVQSLSDLSITATATELNYTDGVTSNIQSQLDTKLASASYTAADVLSKIKTVDGAGSGLDADLLDGQSSAYYATAASVSSEAAARAGGDSSTLTSAQGYTDTAISNLVNGASAAYDTLKEIQDAMATDAELSAAISAITIGNGTQTVTAGSYLTGGGSFTANQTSNSSVSLAVDATSANTASKVVARDASGNFSAGTITATLSGNASTASSAAKLTTARTIGLSGDVSGSVSFDGSANATITATVADDSHNHTIANVDGLQTALDAKLASSSYTAADVLTKIKTVDGSGSGLDADKLDGQSSAYYRINIYDAAGTLLN